jgi:hypothetical protein
MLIEKRCHQEVLAIGLLGTSKLMSFLAHSGMKR